MLALGLFVVHDAVGGGEDDLAELSGGKDLGDELFEVLKLEVVSGGDDTALVETTVELNDDLAVALIVDDLELADVASLLHDSEELDHDLGGGSQENLKEGRVRDRLKDGGQVRHTCLFPAFSALMMVLRLSANTLMSTISKTIYLCEAPSLALTY